MISGVSGRFPESENIAEFSSNLYNKVDLVTQNNRRWEPGLYGLPKCMGCLKDISKFDANFFGVHAKQAHQLDPQARILLELTHEAIVDAGYDPEELRGKCIGVFIGNCSSESDEFFSYDPKKINGYAMTGCCRAMFANRISYTFDFKGPSFLMDTACSSGAFALYAAVQAIQNGECEAAIVGGANLCLRPQTALQFYKLNMLSDDGKCKSFDAACNGYGRSEAIVSMLLQKSDVVRRSYATIVHIKSNTDGYKEQGVTFPSAKMQKQLIEEVYKESKVNPLEVTYVEAHGTGTPAGDPIEMSAIAEIFCKDREEPLLVGAVKSNMGHSEPTSGLCSIVKVLIGMQNNLLPPNLHFYNPNPDISALVNGQVKIVSDATPWNGGYAAVSCFGFGGVNVHTLLKSNCHQQPPEKLADNIPQLVLYAGRTEESVDVLFDYLDKESVPRDFFALLHKSVFSPHLSKPFRGFKIIGGDEVSAVKQVSPSQRPVWYVFSGMGTQWSGMAKDLMNLEVFAKSIHRSAEVLKPFGMDLVSLVTNGEGKKENARSVIPAFVSIAAVQVALVDVLTDLGIKPDGIVGHSVGELGCAYADGCFTAEQMVLAAFWRGKAVEESNLEEGSMAAIGLTWDEAKKLCPPKVFPSCHNAEDSVTISGPKDEVKSFVECLKSQNTFAREVDSCGYAFHSEYIFPAAKKLQAALEKVIPNPKPRTSRWISSSVPQERWNEPVAKEADAAYFVHNLVSPVLFHEALRFVPEDAVVIEIAPHHLLQAILKRVIGPKAEYIGLMKRQVNNAVYLLSSIGRLYTTGLNPDVERLYPKIDFPVSSGTPMISSLIRWDHSESWTVAKWDNKSGQSSQMFVEVDLTSDNSEDLYLFGHCIDGRYLYPATGYLMLAWKALAEIKGKDVSVLPVVFENVKIHRATVLSRTGITRFLVDITSAGGDFEISEAGMTVASGHIYVSEDRSQIDPDYLKEVHNGTKLNSNDIYKELRLRGYDYGPTFQGVVESDLEGKYGLLKWTGDWVVFLDTILQFSMLKSMKRALYLPTRIQSVKIDPVAHKRIADEVLKASEGIPIIHETYTQTCKAGGVEIKNLKATFAPRHQSRQVPLLEEYHFIPYSEKCILPEPQLSEFEKYIHVCSSLSKKILESAGKKEQISDVMNGFTEADDSIISSYLNAMSDEYVLLKTLKGILSCANEDVLKAASSSAVNYLKEREKDIIKNTLTTEVPLRNVLDIVAENISSRKLKVLEISSETVPLTAKVQSHFQNLSQLHVNYIIAHPNPDSLDKGALSATNVKTVKWNVSLPLTSDMKDVDLLVLRDLHCSKKDLNSIFCLITSALQTNGFILLLQQNHLIPGEMLLSALGDVVIPTHTESELEHVFKTSNFEVMCKKCDALTSSLYLLHGRKDTCYENDIVINITENYDQWVDPLKDELVKSQTNPGIRRIWVVGEGTPNSNGIIGLVNCLRQEPGGSDLRCVYMDVTEGPKIPAFSLKDTFYKDLHTKDLTMNVYKRGVWGSFRHVSISSERSDVSTEHSYCNILTRGDLSSLRWVDSPLKYFSSDVSMKDKVLCQVYYAPLNFRDVMLASGKLPPDAIPGDLVLKDCILGLEFSGRDMVGKRVMGILSHQGLATTVAADPEFVWEVPDDWTLEEASTVPVAYSTAYYALLIRGNLKKGERVLIHSGSGGVGQAAISIALSLGCEVFTTVGSSEKKEFLKKRFPQLMDENFCNSRDISFETHILNSTKGEGVNIVLNSLADEKLKASLNCLAEHGRFLEIGKYDLSNNTPLGMAVFLKNISFHGILLDAVFGGDHASVSTKKEIVNLINEGIRNGTVKPLNSILFAHEQVEDAFRFMASGRHIGKVVVKIKDEESGRTVAPSPVIMSAIPRTICHPNQIYIIVGGLGGFGLELCQWLVDRGARRIILTSRSGVHSGYQHLCLKRWKHEQVAVEVSKLNVAKYEEAKLLLSKASSEGTVGGIFNLGMVLRDAFMENQTSENFTLVCESKVQGTTNLDILSKEYCPGLDWFVCFSSVSCGRGNAGQSNYGYANSVMERICEKRRKEGLPGLAIQWGAIGDVGVIQDTVGGEVVIGGTVPQRITSCLSVLDQFIQQEHPVVSSFVPYQQSESKTEKSSKHKVVDTVGHIFGIKDPSTINVDITLGEMGMDSLMGVEIQQFLERDHELVLSIQELRQMKIKDLKKLDGDEGISEDEQVIPEGGDSVPNGLLIVNSEHEIKLSNYLLVPTHTLININGVEKGTPLFIVHPIEGVVTMLSELGKLIQNPAYGLQCTKDTPCTSVEELASWYLKYIRNMGIGPFHLAGYSFGASVAFEMAIQAKNQIETVPAIKSLTMLDGSPALVTTYAKETESRFLIDSQTEGEVYALYAFTQQYTDINVRELKTELFQLPSFEDRVTFVANKLVAAFPQMSVEDVSVAAKLYYQKLLISLKYTPKSKLKQNVLLIKASDTIDRMLQFSELYDLEKVCEGKIDVHTVKGTHKSFLEGEGAQKISKIMNSLYRE